MKIALRSVVAASALAFSHSAYAAVTLDNTSIAMVSGPTEVDGVTTISYSEAGLSVPVFMEWLTFTNTLAGIYSITLNTSSASLDFTSVFITGGGANYDLTKSFDDGIVESWNRTNLLLDAGQYTFTINGNNRGTGALAGTVSIGQAVPEPTTWAMMLLGFGFIGGAMRSAKRRQKVTVSYA